MFLILSLPRSRSAWLAHYLSYPLANPPQLVGHEILRECESVEKFLDSYKLGMWGTVETAGAMLWRIMRCELPDCRVVLIRRPMIEVYRSLAAVGVVADLHKLAEMDAMLDAAATDPGIISVPYHTLSEPFIGKCLFEHCLDLEFDFEWWASVVQTNIQVDMPAWIKQMERQGHIFEQLKEDVLNREISHIGLLNGSGEKHDSSRRVGDGD